MSMPDDPPLTRVLPHSPEAEQSVLGSLLQDNGAMAVIGDVVAAASFYTHAHRLIFSAMDALLADRKPADSLTVFEALSREGAAEDAGGLGYIAQLEACVPSSRNVRRYAEIVAEKSVERALIAAVDEAGRLGWDSAVPVADRIDRMTQALARVDALRKSPGMNRVPMLSLAELREASQSVRWVVKHVVPAESIGMMFGGSGTFKSFIALDAALHVARGMTWLGRKTKQGSVIYVAAEGGAGLWSRIDAWHRARNLAWKDTPMAVVPVALDLGVDAWRVVDRAQQAGITPALVVVDTLSQTYSGEENSANEMAAYLRELGLRFRQLWGCSVMLIHHSGHMATERPRGSSAIRGNLDYMFGVFRDEKEMLATVTCVKQKDGDLFDDSVFQLSVVEVGVDEDDEKMTSLVARHLSNEDDIKRAQAGEQEAGRGGRNQLLMTLVSNGMKERELRKAFYEDAGISDPDARKKAFYRARDWAIKQALIDVAEGIVIDLRKPS